MTANTHNTSSTPRRAPFFLLGAGLLIGAAGWLLLAHGGPGAARSALAPTATTVALTRTSPAEPPAVLAPATPPAPPATLAGLPTASPQPTAPVAALPPLDAPIRYAAIGASDTVGVGTTDPATENWTARVRAQLPADTVYQRFARSGITLYDSLNEELPAAIAFRPKLVTMWLVVNDALRAVPLSVYQKELTGALDELTRKTGAQIVLLNAPDISYALAPNVTQQTRLQMRSVAAAWNQAIAAAAAPYGKRVLIVDLFAPSEAAAQHADWLSPDGFHPSATGYQQIADVTTATMRRAGLIR
jgi:acyl-CoA thioesterase I